MPLAKAQLPEKMVLILGQEKGTPADAGRAFWRAERAAFPQGQFTCPEPWIL